VYCSDVNRRIFPACAGIADTKPLALRQQLPLHGPSGLKASAHQAKASAALSGLHLTAAPHYEQRHGETELLNPCAGVRTNLANNPKELA
jgi:hypothetical protein